MKTINGFEFLKAQRGELIASWGEAQLLRFLDGHYELRGGTPKDCEAAKKWISLYCPHPVVGL
jgi:hypothetical protein